MSKSFNYGPKESLPLISTVSEHKFPKDLIAGKIQLTLYVELDGGVGHPHHVLCDAGQLEIVVISADVDERKVDGVDIGPVHIGLWRENEHKDVWVYD